MLSEILESMQHPIFVEDEGRRRVLLEDGYCKLLGFPREQLLGKRDFELFLGVLTDIAGIPERARAERSLEASEMRYRRLFEAAKDGILILDAETGTIVDVNPFLMELTGFAKEDFVGLHLWEIGPFKDQADSKASFADLEAKAYVRYEDLPLLGRDGREIAVEFISNVYSVDEHKVIQCNVRDITARKQAEKERKVLEQQLHLSQRLESVGRLAGGIAHDFNNLLTVIVSCAELLKEGEGVGAQEQAELVDDILIAGRRAAELTSQLLSFARKQVIAPIPLDLNAVVRECEKLLRRSLGEDVELATALHPDLWMARCDAGQIEQVILNLAMNARDAMPGGGTLTIETANVEVDDDFVQVNRFMRAGPHVRLRVRDTGEGIGPEVKAHVFEPFFTTKSRGKGTGLGLATVYGIVKQNEGSILLESSPDHGATFDVYFPRTTDPAVATPAPSPSPSRGTETVLVVEDDPLVRKVTVRSLGAAGYHVITASNGREALEMAAREEVSFNLLLTDIIMPGLNGLQVADAMRHDRPGLRVLYMSGYAYDVIAKAGVVAPGIEILRKPFSASKLQERVRRALDS